MKLINNIIEPKRVLVIWQAPDKTLNLPTGDRFIVGEITNDGVSTRLKYYDNDTVNAAVQAGFSGFTAYPYEVNKEYNGNLMEVLSKRLPPSARADFADYLRSYRISPGMGEISPLSLLAYTGGKLAGDGFTFAHTFEDTAPPFDFTFEIAGFRHNGLKAFPDLSVLQDVVVQLADDNSNAHDKEAMAVQYQGQVLGYVPKGTNGIVRQLIASHRVSATIEKINGTADRPNVMVFVAVR